MKEGIRTQTECPSDRTSSTGRMLAGTRMMLQKTSCSVSALAIYRSIRTEARMCWDYPRGFFVAKGLLMQRHRELAEGPTAQTFSQENRVRDIPHGSTALTALFLHHP